MSPILQASSARQAMPSSTSLTLDYGLITGAAAASIVLSMIPDAKDIIYPWDPVRVFFLTFVSCFAIIAAVLLLLAAIILGWNENISLDALTAVMFPLAGAIVLIPNVYKSLMLVLEVIRRPSLCIRMDRFRIARFSYSKPCGDNPSSVSKENDFNGVCLGSDCKVRMYIRLFPETDLWTLPSLLHGILRSRFPYEGSPSKDFGMQSASSERLHSSSDDSIHQQTPRTFRKKADETIKIGHSRNFIVVREKKEGKWAWYWQSVSANTHLALTPMKLMLVNQSRALNMLELVSDLLSIGRLVNVLRKNYIIKLWERDTEVISWKKSSTGVICKRLMKQLGLHVWHDTLAKDMRITYRSKTGKYVSKKKRLGILFCILTGKSSFFVDKGTVSDERKKFFSGRARRVSGQEILDDIMKAGDKSHEDFLKFCRKRVDDWLVDWGCDRSSLAEEDDIRQELGMPETEESKFLAGHPSNDWISPNQYDSDSESDDSDCECIHEASPEQSRTQPCFISLRNFEHDTHCVGQIRQREERNMCSGKIIGFPKICNAVQ